jgi:molybdopterin converting factor small subunit
LSEAKGPFPGTAESAELQPHDRTSAVRQVRVSVCVYDHIRDELGRGRLVLELPVGSTVGQLFERLAAEYPLFRQLTDDDSSLYGVNLLVLDGKRLAFPRDTAQALEDNAELHLIPPITGGSQVNSTIER